MNIEKAVYAPLRSGFGRGAMAVQIQAGEESPVSLSPSQAVNLIVPFFKKINAKSWLVHFDFSFFSDADLPDAVSVITSLRDNGCFVRGEVPPDRRLALTDLLQHSQVTIGPDPWLNYKVNEIHYAAFDELDPLPEPNILQANFPALKYLLITGKKGVFAKALDFMERSPFSWNLELPSGVQAEMRLLD